MTTTPLYLDWTFWTAVVALLALVLSQLPPLHVFLRPAKLDVEAFERIHILHMLGEPNVALHLIITNCGGREVKVKSISLTFQLDGDHQFELQGRGYYQSLTDQTAVILTPFKLKSHQDWSHIVNFFTPRTRAEEREVNQIKSAISNNISPRKNEPGNDKLLLEAPQELVTPAMDYFTRKFKWKAGEYRVTLNVIAEPNNASSSQQFRFTIFESDSQQFLDETKRYKFGAGVYYADGQSVPVFLTLVPLSVH